MKTYALITTIPDRDPLWPIMYLEDFRKGDHRAVDNIIVYYHQVGEKIPPDILDEIMVELVTRSKVNLGLEKRKLPEGRAANFQRKRQDDDRAFSVITAVELANVKYRLGGYGWEVANRALRRLSRDFKKIDSLKTKYYQFKKTKRDYLHDDDIKEGIACLLEEFISKTSRIIRSREARKSCSAKRQKS